MPLMEKARQNSVYIHAGSMMEEIPGDERCYNTTVFIGRNGEILAKYRKIHTFDATLPNGKEIRESRTVSSGSDIVTVQTDLGLFGLSIC